MDLFAILIVSIIDSFIDRNNCNIICLLVAAVDGVKLMDTYLQEQLQKVLQKTLNNNKPALNSAADYVRILFNTNNLSTSSTNKSITANTTTTSKILDESDILKVSYCYSTKEWRCLYRCEIDSSILDTNTSKVDLTLFGSINNPTEEDWSQIQMILVANELEILNNNKATTTPPTSGTERGTSASDSASTSSSGMQLYVKTLTGKTITIDVCKYKGCQYFYISFVGIGFRYYRNP